MIAYYYRSRI